MDQTCSRVEVGLLGLGSEMIGCGNLGRVVGDLGRKDWWPGIRILGFSLSSGADERRGLDPMMKGT